MKRGVKIRDDTGLQSTGALGLPLDVAHYLVQKPRIEYINGTRELVVSLVALKSCPLTVAHQPQR
jgi:hypothetical protein